MNSQARRSCLTDYLSGGRSAVDAALRQWLPRPPACPARLAEAIRYAVFPGGKRIRPLLCLMACESCGGSQSEALPGAAAVELVHCYSLVHDDLPAMDDDDLRRGRPTCHRAYDEATAVLAGDALLTLAFELLATRCRTAELAAASCRTLAQAAGYAGMVGGQADDLAASQRWPQEPDRLQRLEAIHRRKTGALIRASLRLGALAASADEQTMKLLDRFGDYLGLLFQITDDLLDAAGSQERAGKRVGKDLQQGKLTYPALLGQEQSRRVAAELCQQAKAAIEPLGPRAERLRLLTCSILERDS